MKDDGVLRVHPVPVASIAPGLVDAMWALYEGHYDHVDRATFDQDLAEKDLVFLGSDRGSGRVVGFSTARFWVQPHLGRQVGIYFSGDTIIHPRYWGQTALQSTVVRTLLAWRLRRPGIPLYWYLICSGYRTYLKLVRNFPNHWPRHDRPSPLFEHTLIRAVGRARYGSAFHNEHGVVSHGIRQPVLKADVAPFTPQVAALPEVRYFQAVNPGYADGDELAMLARVDAGAVWEMARRLVRAAGRSVGVVR